MNLVTMTPSEIKLNENRVKRVAYDLLAHTVWRNCKLRELPFFVYVAYMHRARCRVKVARGSRVSSATRLQVMGENDSQ